MRIPLSNDKLYKMADRTTQQSADIVAKLVSKFESNFCTY